MKRILAWLRWRKALAEQIAVEHARIDALHAETRKQWEPFGFLDDNDLTWAEKLDRAAQQALLDDGGSDGAA